MSDATLYPRFVDVFTKKVDQQEDDPDSGDIIWADHVNKLQNAVVALETAVGPLTEMIGKTPGVDETGTHFEYGPRVWVGDELPPWAPIGSIHFDTKVYATKTWKTINSAASLKVSDADGFELTDGERSYTVLLGNTDAGDGSYVQIINSGTRIVPIQFENMSPNWVPCCIYPGEAMGFDFVGGSWKRST